MTDPISDMLTRIRNASSALLPDVEIPYSKMKESIAQILKRDGYISDWSVEGAKVTRKLKMKLKYQGRQGVISGLRRVSTPGLRRYVGAREIPRVLGGMGVAIISTPKGVMTGYEAEKQNLGGALVCFVWCFYVENWKNAGSNSAQGQGGGERSEGLGGRPKRQIEL